MTRRRAGRAFVALGRVLRALVRNPRRVRVLWFLFQTEVRPIWTDEMITRVREIDAAQKEEARLAAARLHERAAATFAQSPVCADECGPAWSPGNCDPDCPNAPYGADKYYTED